MKKFKKYEECRCRIVTEAPSLEGGIVERVYRSDGGLIKAKVIWDNGKVTYEPVYELDVF